MTVVTIVGQLADSLGHASQTVIVESRDRSARNFDVERRALSFSSLEYRRVQPPATVDIEHRGGPVGIVSYLERTSGGQLFAVCEVAGSALGDDGAWYFSPEIVHAPDGRDITLQTVALTRSSARVAPQPVVSYPGRLRDAAGSGFRRDPFADGLVRRAAEYDKRRRRGDPLDLVDRGRHGAWSGRRITGDNLGEFLAFQDEERRAARHRPPGPIEHGPSGWVLSVR